MKKLLSFLTVFFLTLNLCAQEVTMADKFYSEGKIYVVIAVLSVIFAGLIIYLIVQDRKISRIEKEIRK